MRIPNELRCLRSDLRRQDQMFSKWVASAVCALTRTSRRISVSAQNFLALGSNGDKPRSLDR